MLCEITASDEAERAACDTNVCIFSTGDGTGGSETQIGSAESAQACAALVLETEPTANGATYSTEGTGECYAEFGMAFIYPGATSWESCFLG